MLHVGFVLQLSRGPICILSISTITFLLINTKIKKRIYPLGENLRINPFNLHERLINLLGYCLIDNFWDVNYERINKKHRV
jgi:hypothetical protein